MVYSPSELNVGDPTSIIRAFTKESHQIHSLVLPDVISAFIICVSGQCVPTTLIAMPGRRAFGGMLIMIRLWPSSENPNPIPRSEGG